MQKRNVVNSPRLSELKKKKRKIFIRKILLIFSALALLLASLSLLSRISKINISSVEVEGNRVIDTDLVRKVVGRDIASKYVWLFPKTNIFLYPKSRIKNDLATNFKRFKDITISVQNRKTLLISVSERNPEYTWCGVDFSQDVNKENCYFLDKEGYIFDKAPYFSGNVYFKFYGMNEPTGGDPSGTYLAKGYFDKLILLKDTLTAFGLHPIIALLPEGEDAKILLSKSKDMPTYPEIIFKKNADYEKIAENLKAALDTDPLKSKFKNSYSTLQYIDLRFGNKVYYKF